jgi:AraC-like DNA-binding protein
MTLMRSPLPSLVGARLRDAGDDVEARLATFGLSRALTESHVVAEVDVLAAFYEDAARCLGQPDLGLDLITDIDRGAYGLAEFGIRAAPTIREGLRRLARFAVLLNEATTVEVRETGTSVEVHQRIPGHPMAGGRHSNEYFIAVILAFGRSVTDGGLFAERVWFCHPAPANLSAHRRVFADAVLEFDRPDNGLAIPRSIADTPLASADPALMQAIDAQAEQLLSARSVAHEFLDRVRDGMARSLHEGTPALPDVAELLAMTARTLQRRLAEHDTSFRELLDELRLELHERLVAQGLSAQEIAFRLGYADMGSFRRAQRRWKSGSPG